MSMLNTIDAIEEKIRPVLTVNLWKLLTEIDAIIIKARATAEVTGDFTTVQAQNTVRTAIINVLDERDSEAVDRYLDARHREAN